jgi:hypothetical protein
VPHCALAHSALRPPAHGHIARAAVSKHCNAKLPAPQQECAINVTDLYKVKAACVAIAPLAGCRGCIALGAAIWSAPVTLASGSPPPLFLLQHGGMVGVVVGWQQAYTRVWGVKETSSQLEPLVA